MDRCLKKKKEKPARETEKKRGKATGTRDSSKRRESETTKKEERLTEVRWRVRGNERVTLQVEAWRVGETLSR